ncbi:MAG: pilus assembly protein, partial [Devosia sp.]|nr:pilus assembly protein [Devosia sp.]
MRRLCGLVERFGRDERGVFAVIFGLMAVVLVALSGAVVDYVGLEQNRARGQIALDAVALALQPEMYVTTKAALIERAAALVNDRIGDPRVAARVTDAQINPELGSLSFTGDMTMPTMFVSLVGVPTLSSAIYSEVTRGSLDVEVAVVVDVTGSMNDLVPKGGGGSQPKIEALQTALNQLIDIIVKDEQKPSYSKMAIVPYSMAVNVGAYAEVIRGPITPPTAIAAIDWAASPARTITGATRANPVVITSANHGFVTGDIVYIRSVSGMTQLNNKIYTVEAVNSNSFKLTNTNGTSYSAHSGQNGRVTKCLIASCDLVVKSTGHGLATSDYAYISGTSLKNYANNNNFDWIDNNPSEFDSRFIVWQVDKINADQFSLPDTDPTYQRDYGPLPGSGGTVSCVLQGCQHYRYRNKQLNFRRQEISTCVTERS